MNARGVNRRGLVHSEWLMYLGFASMAVSVILMLANPDIRKLLNDSGGAGIIGFVIGAAIGLGIHWLFVKLGMWGADRGYAILAWIITVLLALNVVFGGLAAIAMIVMGDKLVTPPAATDTSTLPSDASPTSSQASRPSATGSSSIATQASATGSRSGVNGIVPGPSPTNATTSRSTDSTSSSQSDGASAGGPAFDAAETTAKSSLDAAASKLVPDLRSFAKLVASPPLADKKAIEDRRASCVAVLAKVDALLALFTSAPVSLEAAMVKDGASQADATARRVRASINWNLSKRILAGNEIREALSLAISECDALLAALGSWSIEGGKVVGKDAVQTTQLNDARFFLRAKLGQLETRMTQLRGQ